MVVDDALSLYISVVLVVKSKSTLLLALVSSIHN